jgi:DNA-binding NarL/FixJ family response regulator
MGIRVLIADDHKIMLAGLRSLLEKQTDFDVVAEAENGRKAVQIKKARRGCHGCFHAGPEWH